MPWKWYDAAVTKIEDQTANTKRFWLQMPEDAAFDFRAGQFVTLDLPIAEKRLQRWRSYSIANAPVKDEPLELCVVRLEGGAGTRYLFEDLQVGDQVRLKGPAGVFTLPKEIEYDLVLICTGTGVAPFRSMLKEIKQQAKQHRNIHLIFGTRHEAGILYREEFEQLRAELPNFRYSVALSREADLDSMRFDFPVYPGYVHQIYERCYPEPREDIRFYLCGWSNMIDEAKERLLKLGYQEEQIIFELYG